MKRKGETKERRLTHTRIKHIVLNPNLLLALNWCLEDLFFCAWPLSVIYLFFSRLANKMNEKPFVQAVCAQNRHTERKKQWKRRVEINSYAQRIKTTPTNWSSRSFWTKLPVLCTAECQTINDEFHRISKYNHIRILWKYSRCVCGCRKRIR